MPRRPSSDASAPRRHRIVGTLIGAVILILILIWFWHIGIIGSSHERIEQARPSSSFLSASSPLSTPSPTVTAATDPSSSSPTAGDRGSVRDHFEAVFPDNEASFIHKPYLSSVAQCHLTSTGIACSPPLRNVRWKEPLAETHIYDLDSAPARSQDFPPQPDAPCLTSLQGS